MKKAILLLAGISLLFALEAFKPASSDYFELKNHAVLGFNTGPHANGGIFASNTKRGSYDNSSYEIDLDTAGHVSISDVKFPNGPHQSELSLIGCFGSISKTDEWVYVKCKTYYNNLYLVRMSEPLGVDTFASNATISFKPKSLNKEQASVWVLGRGYSDLKVLPKDIDIEEIWQRKHPDNTIALFKDMEVIDTTNSRKSLPPGDYIMIAGNSFTLTE